MNIIDKNKVRDEFHYNRGYNDGFIKGSQHGMELLTKIEQLQTNTIMNLSIKDFKNLKSKEKKHE